MQNLPLMERGVKFSYIRPSDNQIYANLCKLLIMYANMQKIVVGPFQPVLNFCIFAYIMSNLHIISINLHKLA